MAVFNGTAAAVRTYALVALNAAEHAVQTDALLDEATIVRTARAVEEKRDNWERITDQQKYILFLRLLTCVEQVRTATELDTLGARFYESMTLLTEQYGMHVITDDQYVAKARALYQALDQ